MTNEFHKYREPIPDRECGVILVTGGCGFIGSHVAEEFARLGKEVIVFDNMSRSGSEINKKYLEQYDEITFVVGDVRNFNDCFSVMKYMPDVIVHCAGQTAVTTSMDEPYEDFRTNTLGTMNILESARQANLRPAIIFTSTNKVFGERVSSKGEALGPTDLTGHSPYGCSKLCADHYIQEYGFSFGFDVLVLRMSCIYGTRQFGVEDQGWVAHFVITTYLDKPVTIFGDGNQRRDLLYIDDLVNAMKIFATKKITGINVMQMGGGINNTMSLLELLVFLGREMNKTIKLKFDKVRPFDQHVYISDIRNVCKRLQWEPEVSPYEGVKRLLKWVKENEQYWK